jgi:hypothetical protein
VIQEYIIDVPMNANWIIVVMQSYKKAKSATMAIKMTTINVQTLVRFEFQSLNAISFGNVLVSQFTSHIKILIPNEGVEYSVCRNGVCGCHYGFYVTETVRRYFHNHIQWNNNNRSIARVAMDWKYGKIMEEGLVLPIA